MTRKIELHDLKLFAVNSGELYQTHKALTGSPVSCWLEHVQKTVLPLYCRQVEPVICPLAVAVDAAAGLAEYYQQHAADWARIVMAERMQSDAVVLSDLCKR